MELEELGQKLDAALNRIGQLEEQLSRGSEPLRWHYLTYRPHRWRRQLSLKGRNMTVGQLVSTVRANRLTPEQAGEELDLPVGAIYEALTYYAENRELIELEAAEERRRLAQRGYALEPKDLPR